MVSGLCCLEYLTTHGGGIIKVDAKVSLKRYLLQSMYYTTVQLIIYSQEIMLDVTSKSVRCDVLFVAFTTA